MEICPNAPNGYTWENLMLYALEEAKKAREEEEIPVGALIISAKGEILSKAHNLTRTLCDPTAHAEIIAIREAAKKINNYRLLNSFLVVTLEPCIMCLGALREARISGIIFGAYDAQIGAISSLIEGTELHLNSPKPWFMGGICEEECKTLLKDFFIKKRY